MPDRAQAFTLEATLAAVVVLASVLFALQATLVTPLSTSTTSEHVEHQQGRLAAGLLAHAAAEGTLRPTVLAWNDTAGVFPGTVEGYYTTGGPPTAFGRTLDRVLGDRGITFNVHVEYVSRDGTVRTERLVHVGTPSAGAVSASRRLTLYDDDVLYRTNGTATATELTASGSFYAPDAAPGSPLYNVVEVEVIAWRS